MSSLPPLPPRPPRGPLGPVRRLLGLGFALVLAASLAAATRYERPGAPTGVAGMDALPGPPAGRSWAPRPRQIADLTTLATAGPDGLTLNTAGGPVRFLPGVNLGSTEPGHQPGELPATAADYRRWFAAMTWLGIRVVRVYTIHPPAFYAELVRHNRAHPDRPLYLVQGVYLPDESYVTVGDLYPAADAFDAEIRDAVDAVHGQLRRDTVAGRASGDWTADASGWLVAWIVGVEWEPYATKATNDKHAADAPPPAGVYFRATAEASAAERWIAARLDTLATAEAHYGRSVPLAAVNWPTTDPLRHPEEPLEYEDLVGVDANHMLPTDRWPGGTFASYHAYPYYPDFQRHEPALQRFVHGGRVDPYAGYLDALRRHHAAAGLPVVVSEFGVPSSLGAAHTGPLGRDQGNHSEVEAMRIDAELLTLIQDLGLAGGFLFSWADEWFKFTWNTIAHQEPADRRALWHDPLTNEQHFGLVATDATGAVNPGPITVGPVTAHVDEQYLHLRVPAANARTLTLGFDTLAGEAAGPPPFAGSGGVRAEAAFSLDLSARTGESWIRADLDPVSLDYRRRPPPPGGWLRYALITNRDSIVPSTGERLPAEFLDVGALRYGTPEQDSRNLWYRDGPDVIVRVPWALAGFADPSSRAVLVPQGDRTTATVVDGIRLIVSTDGTDRDAGLLTWAPWQRVGYAERLKSGAGAVRNALIQTAALGER